MGPAGSSEHAFAPGFEPGKFPFDSERTRHHTQQLPSKDLPPDRSRGARGARGVWLQYEDKMSHAVVLVALPGDVAPDRLEGAVENQMAPFDENGTCFRSGSRWDWWVIGGRWSGYFEGRDYVRVSDIDPERTKAANIARLTDTWNRAQADKRAPTELIYGVKAGERLEDFLARKSPHWFRAAYAFLRERHWHEGQRMGWFGMSAATECEIKKPGQKYLRCRTKAGKGAAVVTWNEDRDAPADTWAAKFYERFVKPLPADSWLVAVDYHV